jgi:four helix bundle protein
MTIKSYKDLDVWQKSMDMAREIYTLVRLLPSEELYGLSNQMRRAAVSVPSNIAEGNARNSTKEYSYFLSVARGSVAELETQLQLCSMLGYILDEKVKPCLDLLGEIGKMTTALTKALNMR